MKHIRVGFAICGSFCTHSKVLEELAHLTEVYDTVVPILSESSRDTDTRFGTARDLAERVQALTGRECISTIREAEPIGPKALLDVLDDVAFTVSDLEDEVAELCEQVDSIDEDLGALEDDLYEDDDDDGDD